jgi:hypothetical protein
MALFLFEASSEDVVRCIGRRTEVPFDRIVESALFGFVPPLDLRTRDDVHECLCRETPFSGLVPENHLRSVPRRDSYQKGTRTTCGFAR